VTEQDKDEAGTRGGQAMPQGFGGAGDRNAHGAPSPASPGNGGPDDVPYAPEGGRPATDPDAKAQAVLDQAKRRG
jgi:hypothetical protein